MDTVLLRDVPTNKLARFFVIIPTVSDFGFGFVEQSAG